MLRSLEEIGVSNMDMAQWKTDLPTTRESDQKVTYPEFSLEKDAY